MHDDYDAMILDYMREDSEPHYVSHYVNEDGEPQFG